jgi:phosphatidylserine synthase
VGWLVCLLLAFAMALRLARFNVMIDGPERPTWQKAYAVGVPAPAGALMVMLPLTLSLSGMPSFPGDSVMILIWTAIATALIISRLPTFSGKGLGTPVPREWVLAILGGAVVILALAFSHPFETISAMPCHGHAPDRVTAPIRGSFAPKPAKTLQILSKSLTCDSFWNASGYGTSRRRDLSATWV